MAETAAPTPPTDGTPLAAGGSGLTYNGVVLSETQLGNMALRAKQQRTKAEQDKQLLQNRINRLVIEQERAEKRIAETRRRANEITTLKKRNEQNSTMRADASTWLESETQLQRELLQDSRKNRASAIQSAKQAMFAVRKEEVAVLKQMRSENEAAIDAQKNLELQRAQERKKLLREHQREASERKAKEQEAMSSELRAKRESKRQELDGDAVAHLDAYSALAKEEARLIASLQKWHAVQDDAFKQLDGVLGTTGRLSSRLGSSRGSSRPVSRQPAMPTSPRIPEPAGEAAE